MNIPINNDLLLRYLTPADAPQLFSIVDKNRARLKQWLPWLDRNKIVANSEKFIEICINDYKSKKGFCFAVQYQSQLVGLASLQFVNSDNRSANIGYWIDQAYAGKGLVKNSAQCLMRYAFEELNLNRIEIRCATGNIDSQRIPEKLNFQFEGTARQCEWLYDHFVDHKVYSLLKSEYESFGQ